MSAICSRLLPAGELRQHVSPFVAVGTVVVLHAAHSPVRVVLGICGLQYCGLHLLAVDADSTQRCSAFCLNSGLCDLGFRIGITSFWERAPDREDVSSEFVQRPKWVVRDLPAPSPQDHEGPSTILRSA
jgi:hypothetical protein